MKHPRFILKPVFGTRGAGIEVVEFKNVEDARNHFIGLYNSGVTAIIVEELIKQHEKLKEIHQESTNTIRVITIRYNDRIEVIHPFLRVGRGKSVVDNAGSGGIICDFDPNTGIVYAACDELGKSYQKHPDTNKDIIGFAIPRWEEAVEIVKKIARVLPNVRYVGWDMALSDNGWVLIEGNDKGQFVFQFPTQEGFRDEMNEILREFGKPELN